MTVQFFKGIYFRVKVNWSNQSFSYSKHLDCICYKEVLTFQCSVFSATYVFNLRNLRKSPRGKFSFCYNMMMYDLYVWSLSMIFRSYLGNMPQKICQNNNINISNNNEQIIKTCYVPNSALHFFLNVPFNLQKAHQ